MLGVDTGNCERIRRHGGGSVAVVANSASACTPSALAQLAPEHFEPLVGEAFSVGEHRVTLRAVRRGPATPAQFREQFAVTFSIPQSPSIGGEPVRVAHPAIGGHDLFVAAVSQGADRSLEICFA